MILAHRFQMPLQEFRRKTSSTEFNDWNYFYEHIEPELDDTLKYYLAQIAFRIVWVNAKENWKGRISDFLIKFKRKDVVNSGEDKEQALQQSKARWGGLVGLKNLVMGKKDG